MIKTTTFFTPAVLIAINGRMGIGHGAILYVAVAIGAICLLAGLLSHPPVKNRWLAAAGRPRVRTARLLAVLFSGVMLSHAIYRWAYPEFTLEARLDIDVFSFTVAAFFLFFLSLVRNRVARAVV